MIGFNSGIIEKCRPNLFRSIPHQITFRFLPKKGASKFYDGSSYVMLTSKASKKVNYIANNDIFQAKLRPAMYYKAFDVDK